jgi:hypothetical protein
MMSQVGAGKASPPRERPAPETEVTEEMLDAANAVLTNRYLGDGIYDLRREVLAEVFRAMDGVRAKSFPRTHR